MRAKHTARATAAWLAAGIGCAAATYGAMIAATRWGYGVVPRQDPDEMDPLLDRFMPTYEVVERHVVRVAAPADTTLAVAYDMDLNDSAIVRAIFRTRELVLGVSHATPLERRPLVTQIKELGWGVLAEIPGREIVFGAVTQPWIGNVVFQAPRPGEFAGFNEPGYVKIAWTLRADPLGANQSIFRTETRAVATDPPSRAAFRRYWSFVQPGVLLIRRLSLRLVKAEAERRARRVRAAA